VANSNNPKHISKIFSVDAGLDEPIYKMLQHIMLIWEIFWERNLVVDHRYDILNKRSNIPEEEQPKIEYSKENSAMHFDCKLDLKLLLEKHFKVHPDERFDYEDMIKKVENGDYKGNKAIIQNMNQMNIPGEFFTNIKTQLKKKKFSSNKFVLKFLEKKPDISNKTLVVYLRQRIHSKKQYSEEYIEVKLLLKDKIISAKTLKNFKQKVLGILQSKGVVPLTCKALILFWADYKNFEWKNIDHQKQLCLRNGDEIGFSMNHDDEESFKIIEQDNFQTDEFVAAKLSKDSDNFDYFKMFNVGYRPEKEVAFKINIEK
jgi:hypothetical protein